MATTNYEINYDDERFTQVESEKETALNNINDTYNNMINQSDKYYQDQIDAAKDYADTQSQLQQDNTNLLIDQINQQIDKTEKDYTKEQKGAYADWQKQSNQYGVNAEQMAASGLAHTGYSESSQVSMYNTYQNRVATARESFNQAVLNYNNSIKEAQLANNSKLAEIAYNALQTQLELSLQGFQYKNSLLSEQIQQQQATEDRYYSRWQDVLNQMNQENQFAESIRQYEQNYKFEQEQFAESIRQYEQNYKLQLEQFAEEKKQYEQDYQLRIKSLDENIRQFNEEIARLKKKDAEEYAMEIQKLELQKKQMEQAKKEADREYELKVKQMEQSQSNWEKEYQLAKSSAGGGGGNYTNTTGYTDTPKQEETPKQTNNTFGNDKSTMNKKDYYFDNGYQPRYVNNSKLSGIGVKVSEVFGNQFGSKVGSQKIWKSANNRYYVWVGDGNKGGQYVDVTSYASQIKKQLSVGDKIANLFR